MLFLLGNILQIGAALWQSREAQSASPFCQGNAFEGFTLHLTLLVKGSLQQKGKFSTKEQHLNAAGRRHLHWQLRGALTTAPTDILNLFLPLTNQWHHQTFPQEIRLHSNIASCCSKSTPRQKVISIWNKIWFHSFVLSLTYSQAAKTTHLCDAGIQVAHPGAFTVPWSINNSHFKTTQPLLKTVTRGWLWTHLFLPICSWWGSVPPPCPTCESSGLTRSSLSPVPGGLRSCL